MAFENSILTSLYNFWVIYAQELKILGAWVSRQFFSRSFFRILYKFFNIKFWIDENLSMIFNIDLKAMRSEIFTKLQNSKCRGAEITTYFVIFGKVNRARFHLGGIFGQNLSFEIDIFSVSWRICHNSFECGRLLTSDRQKPPKNRTRPR